MPTLDHKELPVHWQWCNLWGHEAKVLDVFHEHLNDSHVLGRSACFAIRCPSPQLIICQIWSLHAWTLPPFTDAVWICRNGSMQLWMSFQLKSSLQTYLRRHREVDVSSCDRHAAVIITIVRHQHAEDVKKQWPVFWFEENVVVPAGSPVSDRGQKQHMWEHFWLVPSTKLAWTQLQCSL